MPTGNSPGPSISRIGVVTRNLVSLRAKADAKSEQVTQAVIGQSVTIEGGAQGWLYVQTWDTYRAWIPSEAIRILPSAAEPYASVGAVAIIRELFVDLLRKPHDRSEIITKATIGTELEVIDPVDDWVELLLPDTRHAYIRKNEARLLDKDLAQTIPLPDPRRLVETAGRFTGVPYLWGGTSPFGLDCSGFVQLVHKIHNVTLLRDAHLQASDPRAVPVEVNELQAGDLVFFAGNLNKKTITHVGMMIDRKRFIHSQGKLGVTTTTFDDPDYAPIYNCARRMRLATLDPGGGAPKD